MTGGSAGRICGCLPGGLVHGAWQGEGAILLARNLRFGDGHRERLHEGEGLHEGAMTQEADRLSFGTTGHKIRDQKPWMLPCAWSFTCLVGKCLGMSGTWRRRSRGLGTNHGVADFLLVRLKYLVGWLEHALLIS